MTSRVIGRVGNVLLTVAAGLGAVCALAVLGAVLFGVSLTMFATGSMAPAIPAGSVALIRDVPATEVHVGDVVTVQRPAQLPITHRVRSVTPVGADAVELVLRGDANAEDDPEPYRVSRVGLVLFSVPGLAPVIVTLSRPQTLGLITVAAAALVLWAFWPRRRAVTGAAVLLGALVVVGAQAWLGVPPAAAAEREHVITGRVITLVTVGDADAMGNLVPGVEVDWQVGVLSEPPEPGRIRIVLAARGPLTETPEGLQLTIRDCPQRWVDGHCPDVARTVLSWTAAHDVTGRSGELTSFRAGEPHWLLVTVRIPDGFVGTGTAELGITASGQGDAVATPPQRPELPATGAPELRFVLVVAATSILVGAITFAVPSARARRAWRRL